MDNKPDDPGRPVYTEAFGENWGLDDQCRQEFGSGFQLCRAFGNADPCKYLWCSSYEKPLLCTTKRGTPLPGTDCGQDMVGNKAENYIYKSIEIHIYRKDFQQENMLKIFTVSIKPQAR